MYVCVCVCEKKNGGLSRIRSFSCRILLTQLFFHLPTSDHVCAFFQFFWSTLNREKHLCHGFEYMEKYNKLAFNTTNTIIIILENKIFAFIMPYNLTLIL